MDFQDERGSAGEIPETGLTGESAVAAATAGRGQRLVLQPGPDNVVVLPAGAALDDLSVQGRDIIITMPDGRVFVIPDGAVYVPQIVVGDVVVPPLNLAALLTGNEPQPAAGGVPSSGGNFADPTGPIQAAYGLGDLLPYTELSFSALQEEEVLPQPIDNLPDIVIQVDGAPAARDAVDSVDEAGLAGNRPNGNQESPGSSTGDGSDRTSGAIIVTSADGVASITVNGVVVTGVAGQQIQGSAGVLTLGALNGNQITYTYSLTDNTAGDTTTDQFTVVITDADGDVATATLTLDIADDVPTARADADMVPAGDFSGQSGNVLTGEGTTSGPLGADTAGADGAAVTAVRAGTTGEFSGTGSVAGQYGTLTISSSGAYTYVRTPGTAGGVNDVFTYQLTDGDGDATAATLTINIEDRGPAIISVPEIGDGTEVNENQLPPTTDTREDEAPGSEFVSGPETATGTITFHSGDGISSVSLGGTVIAPGALPQVVTSDGTGTLTVISFDFDPATGDGSITYVYTLNDNTANTDGTTVSFDIVVVDADGDTATDTLDIHIIDDVPAAVSDAGSTTEGATLTVAAIAGVLVNDTMGADGAAITGVAAGSNIALPVSGDVGVEIAGTYGTLTLNADGSYVYKSAANAITGAEQDVFVYTITDGDGDTSTATLTINLSDVTLVADNQTRAVDEAALDTTTSGADLDHGTVTGSTPSSAAETVTGTLDVSGVTGFTAASGSTAYGVYQVNADGTYTYTLTKPYTTSPSTNDGAQVEAGRDSFSYTAHDANGNEVTGTVTIDIKDDVPSIALTKGAEGEVVLTTHDALTIGDASNAASSSGAFGSVFSLGFTPGADGASSPVLSYDLAIADAVSGLTSQGVAITLYELADGTVVGSTAADAPAAVSDASVVFSVSVVADGTVTLTQYQQVDHPVASDPGATAAPFEDHLAVLCEGKLTLTASATATDGDGDTASDSETVDLGGNLRFTDDGPVTSADVDSVTEGASTSGDVLANDAGGADGFAAAPAGSVTGVASVNQGTSDASADGSGNFVLAGAFGTLTLNRDGSYTYQSNADAITGAEQDVFEYTIVDGDGDTSTATLTINLSDVTLVADNQAKTVDEAALDLVADDRGGTLNDDLAAGSAEGSNPEAATETVSGTLNVSGAASYALVGSATGAFGQIQINSDGTYTYTLTAPVDGDTTTPAQGGGNGANTYTGSAVESFNYEATDADGNTVQGTILINIVDDVPVAVDQAALSVAEDAAAIGGNVLANDTQGADGAAVTSVNIGGTDHAVAAAGVTTVSTAKGVYTFDAAGNWTFDPAAGLDQSSGAIDASFTYTLTDGDGDTDTATQPISITDGAAPSAGAPISLTVDDENLADGSDPSTPVTDAGAIVFTPGSDAIATIAFGTDLTGLDPSLTWSRLDAATITGSDGATPVVTLKLTRSGDTATVTATLSDNYDAHPTINADDLKALGSVAVIATDIDGGIATSSVSVSVSDDVPAASGDGALQATENAAFTINALGNDTYGADGVDTANAAKVFVSTQANQGTVTYDTSTGLFTYTPNAGAGSSSTSDSFEYTIVDRDGDTSTATVSVTLQPDSEPQGGETVARVDDDGLTGGNAASVTGDIDANVDDDPADTSEASFTGTVSFDVGNDTPATITFDASLDGTIATIGLESVTYSVSGNMLTATVSGGVRDETPLFQVEILDGQTGEYRVTLLTNVLNQGGPNNEAQNAFASIDFAVTDSEGDVTTTNLGIVFNDDAPTAYDNANAVDEGGSIGGNVLSDDTADVFGADGPGGIASFTDGVDTAVPGDTIETALGFLTINSDGSYTYQSKPNSTASDTQDSFTYTIVDADGDTSTATLTIDITATTGNVSDNDVIVDESGLDNGTYTGSQLVPGGEFDTDGQISASGGTPPYSYVLTSASNGTYGALTLNGTTGEYSYTLDTPFTDAVSENSRNVVNGAESFGYEVYDDLGNPIGSGSISINIVDDVPVAVDQAALSVAEDAAAIDGNVLANDTQGADGAAVTSVNIGGTDHAVAAVGVTTVSTAKGDYTFDAAGNWTFDPAAGLDQSSGAIDASFTYTLTDGDGDTDTATQPISITDGAGPSAGVPISLTVDDENLADGSDPSTPVTDAGAIVFTAGSDAIATIAFGTDLSGLDPSLTWSRLDATTITGSDGATPIVTLKLTRSGDTATVTATLSNNYDAHPAINADDLKALGSVTVIATDIDGDTATSSVSVSVSDDVPTASDDSVGLSEDTASVGGNVLTNDEFGADGPNATAQISAVSGTSAGVVGGDTPGTYGTLQLNLNGTYTYVLDTAAMQGLDAGEQRTDTFSYTIKDGEGDTSTVQLTVTINGANDAPLANDDTNWVLDVTSGPNPTTSGNVLENVTHAGAPSGTFADVADTDVDVEALTITAVAGGSVGSSVGGSHGSIVINANGGYTYTLNASDGAVNALNDGEFLTDSFTYTVSDGTATDTATVTVTIFGTNDVPVVTGSAVAVSEETLTFGNPDDNPVSPAEADTTNSVTANGSISITDADAGDAHTVALGTPTQTLYTPDGVTALTWDLSADGHTLKGYSSNIHDPEILVTIDDAGSFTVTLGDPVRHTDTTTEDLTSFVIPVTVSDGTAITILSNGITVTIEDDSPTAVADTDSVLEGSSTWGDVLLNSHVGGDSTPAWPLGMITGLASVNQGTSDAIADGSGNFVLAGEFGTLTLNSNGHYTYQSNANSTNVSDKDVFQFTMVDADGDPSTATLTINVLDVTLVADNQTKQVDEAALDTTTSGDDLGNGSVTGSNPGSTAETVTGTLQAMSPTGIAYVPQSLTTAYGMFELNSDGTYTYTLINPYTTTPDANNGAVVEPAVETFTYTAHDVYGNTVTGTVTINVKDDVPTAITPQATSMNNAIGVSGGNYLDDDNDVDSDYGADGGQVIFTAATITSLQSQNLTSGFASLNYAISADGTVLTATKSTDGSTVFTISLQPAGSSDQYVVNISQKVDSSTTIDFNAGNYNFEGGNSSWAGFVIKPEDIEGNSPTTIDNNSQDLLLTPEVNGTNASTLKTTANIGGVGGGASMDSTETFRVDFVTDLRGNPADGSGEYEKVENRDHVFDGHYTVNGASALFKSTTSSTVTIAAYDDADGNSVVGDGVQDTINAVVITWHGGTNSGLITTGGVYNVNGHNFTVTFNANGSVTVAGVEGDTGSSMVGTVIAVYTANGYNSVEYTHAGGNTFQIGDFGATVQTTNPVNFTVPVTIVDNDGDTASGGSLAITLNPTTPPVVLDLDGDGVEFLALADGVNYDYGSGLVQSAWVAADDGLLSRDTGSGLDIVFSDDVSGAGTDLEGLKLAYDSDGDGKLTAADAGFGEFGVWQDANSNGLVDTGEFQSLLKMGITSIDLTAEGSGTVEAGGDVVVHGTGQYTMKGTTYALADVSFVTTGADDRIAARTTEIAAVSLAAAGFMAAEAVHAEALPPAAIETVVAALQTFETPAPEIQASLPETSQTSFVTPLAEEAPKHEEADAMGDSVTDSSDQEAQHGLTEVEPQDLAPEPLSAPDDTHVPSAAPEFSFGGSDSALMQALLLAAQTSGSDEQKPANLAEVREAIADSAGQHTVDSLIDHFVAHDVPHETGVADTALDHALGTMLVGAGVDGLHMAGIHEGFELAAMAAAAEAHSVAVA